MAEKIRVLVGDDDPIIMAGLQATLGCRLDLEIVGEIKAPAQTLPLIKTLKPDVVVIDLDWWGDQRAGIGQIRQIRKDEEKVKIIAITAYPQLIELAKQAGADESRRKGFRASELAESILAVAQMPNTSPLPPLEVLSEREIEVLKLMAEGLTDKEIGKRLIVSEATVKSHARNIISKLGVKNRTEAVAKGYENRLL